MKQDVLGLQFDNVTMDEAVARAEELLEAPGASIVVTPNAEIGYEALHDAQFRALLNGADLVLPDGAGVVLAAKLRKTPLKQKVAGVDFADRLLGVLAETGKTLYLLGGKPGIAELAAQCSRSVTAFRRAFEQAMGTTPFEFLYTVRVRAAMNLLCGSEMSVSEIAAHVGYQTLSSFNRHFLRIAGESPSAFRRRCGK